MEEIVDVCVSRLTDEITEVLKLQRCTVEQTVDMQAPYAQEKLVDVSQLILQE